MSQKRTFVRYEDGADRILKDEIAPDKHTIVHDGFVVLPPHYWRGAGVAVPVFSLRSENSFGVGEFADLKLLADWGKKVGLKLIQLLPVNDTSATHSWKDSYPYAAISAFALHPIYLNLAAVANAKNKKLLQALEPERQRLNALETVDYEAVMSAKLGFLKTIFPSQKAATFRTRGYKDFFAENQHWLVPYAAFCFLRDQFGTADFSRWPEHKTFDAEKIAALVKGNDEIAFHFFVQYHLHLQLKGATAQVHSAGLVLKGDLAIGVYRHGADAWQQPELFHMDMQAGAPPDAFAAKGQNWGFPTYNWPRMAADGFAWWKQRFAQMRNYFDAFRIDHILGFFRIWSSPAHAVEGILGYFVPAIAIEPSEFSARGIIFDRDRLTKPFITDAVLREIFGTEADLVRREFLKVDASGLYSLKPEFATQTAGGKSFCDARTGRAQRKIENRPVRFDQQRDPAGGGRKIHFRFAMEQTASFKYLPPDTQAKLRDLYVDYFFRRQDDFWMREAMQKLPALKRVTNMLICGEDLGLVPACVPEVMRDLGFLSLEIQRMPENPWPGIFAPGGRAVFERGHAVHARHEHDPRLVAGRPRVDTEIFQPRTGPARRSAAGMRTENRRGGRAAASRVTGDVEHFPVAGFAGHGWPFAPRRCGGRADQRAGDPEFLLALPAAPDAGKIAAGGNIQLADWRSCCAKTGVEF